MSPSRLLVKALATFALIFFTAKTLPAQVPDPTIAAQGPVPGAGHHYIGNGAETVNPADGSLSFDLPLQPPPGRGLSAMFGIRFSGGEQFYLSNGITYNQNLVWTPNWEPAGQAPWQVGAWSYDLPILTATTSIFWSATIPNNGCPNGVCTYSTNYCYGNDSYVFRGLDGVQYSVPLGSVFPDPNNQQQGYCPAPPNNVKSPGNNHGILSSFQSSSLTNIVDQSGTTYQFPVGSGQPSEPIIPPSNPIMWGDLATSITDRNGNQLTLSGNSYKDSTGRTAVSWTGIGNTGDQITVSGLGGPITLRWTTTPVSYPETGYNSGYTLTPCALNGGSTNSVSVMSEIDLPNSQKYTFQYDGTYGKVSKITFPDGGYIRYAWGLYRSAMAIHASWTVGQSHTPESCDFIFDVPAVTDRYVSFDGSTEVLHQQFSYALPTWSGNTWSTKQTTVTSTDLLTNQVTKTVYTYGPATADTNVYVTQPPYSRQIPVETNVLYQDGTGKTYKEINKTWLNPHVMLAEQTILYDSSGNRSAGSTTVRCYDANEQVTNAYEYGFQSEGSYPGDQSCYSSVTKTGSQNTSYIGPLRRQTTTPYHPFFTWNGGTPPTWSGTHIVNAPDSVTLADGSGVTAKQTLYSAYGEVTSSTDQNNLVTTYKYVDNLARLTEIDYPTPDGGVTTKTYVDTPNAVSVETKNQIDGTRWTDALILYDGLGQAVAQSTANGEATPWDRIDTCYDGTGRARFSSYRYQVAAATTAPNCTTGVGDTMTYDSLGRTTQVSHSDGNTILTSYTGRATQVQDEGNGTHRVQRISQIDGLGRLASVCEVTNSSQLGNGGTPAACGQDISATGFLTSYSYNTLGDLLSVTQGTLTSRTFQYDFLSRLTSATNPESGTISYVYDTDPAGTCPTPYSFAGLLVKKLDARSVRTCYQYVDALNRMTQKNYSDGTPTASLNYDQTSAYGVSLLNTTGRLTSQSTASPNPTGEVFSYDQLGRVKINSQCTPQNCSTPAVFPVTYTYDLLGDMLTSTNGAGVTLTYAVNTAARLTSLTSSLSDSNHPGTLFSSSHYNAAGALLSATLGGSVGETRTYDARLRLASIADGSNYSLTIPSSGGYAPNSDILAANDSVNLNWVYAYDDFNRLICSNLATNGTCASPNSGTATYTYDYDRYGNRWHQDGPFSMQLSFSGNNNRMDSYSFDSAGNLLNDGSHSYFYDAENRLIQVDGTLGTCSLATACYVYNASGQRVRKTTSSTSVDYLYDLGGQEITELSSAGAWNRGEVYAGSRHLATYNGGTTSLIHADWLGTERVRTTAAGASCETIASLPFGDGQAISGSCGDPSPMHFTGKERDPESGLDNFGARYNASNFGRFMSPDPGNIGVNRLSPQTWNAYSYSLNNPLVLTDPTGLYVCEDSEKCDSANDKAFAKSLADAQAAANKLTGDDKAAAQRAIDSYGAKGDDNGVNVRFDSKIDGAVTEVSGVANGNKSADLNPNGQNINVTFNPNNIGGDTVAHEGSHVADGSAWVASGFAANKNPTNFTTEFNAYHVQFNILNALGVIQAPPGMKSTGASIPFSNPLSWRAGDTFKKITPDLKQRIIEDYENLNSPAFQKGSVLEP